MHVEAEICCYLCCSVHGYWHEAVPALQPGKSLWNAEAIVHRLPGCSWKPRNYTPSRKPWPLVPAGKIWFIASFAVWKYAPQRIFWEEKLDCRCSRRFDVWLATSQLAWKRCLIKRQLSLPEFLSHLISPAAREIVVITVQLLSVK